MRTEKEFNILTAFTMLFFAFVLTVMVLICIFPGDADPVSAGNPWYVWVVLGGTLVYISALIVFFFVMHGKDKKQKKAKEKQKEL